MTEALGQMGLQASPNWAKYHQALNRARWSGLQVTGILLKPLVQTFVSSHGPVEGERLPNLAQIAIDSITEWQQATLAWYGGDQQTLDRVSDTAWWYSTGTDPSLLRT